MTAKGATVLFAENAAEANRYVLDIARRHGVKSVVKSKSMVSEEMELNHVLSAAGIRAGRDRPGRIHRAVGRPAADPHRHAGHSHVGRRRGPALRGETGRALHRGAPGPDGHRPPPPPRRVSAGRHGHLGRPISPSPTPARSCWSRTRATPGSRPPRRRSTSPWWGSKRCCRGSTTCRSS